MVTNSVPAAHDILGIVASNRNRIIKRIPKNSRALAASTLRASINNLLESNAQSTTCWLAFLCFANLCLRAPRAGLQSRSRYGNSSLAVKVNQNMRNFEADLIDYTSRPAFVARAVRRILASPEEALARRVSEKISDYDITGAVRLAASDNAVLSPSAEIASILRTKHPSAPVNLAEPPHSADGMPPSPLTVTSQQVLHAINSFNSGTAGGLDGLRPRHLQDMVAREVGAEAEALLQAITRLCNFIFQSGVPADFTHIFYGGKLTALSKKDGGVRPVAVGLLFRRLCSKLATASAREDAVSFLRPLQVGFGVRGGCEAAIHAARSFVVEGRHQSDPFVLLKLDFKNAFNCIRRDKILFTVFEKFPKIYQYVFNSYGSQSSLIFGDETILSSEGVQQGDPMGSFLFATTIHSLVSGLQSSFNLWYLDDGVLAGDPATVAADFERIKSECASLGLELSVEKCEVASHNFSVEGSSFEGCKVVNFRNLTLLGSPLGDQAADECLTAKISTLERFETRLRLLQPHQAFYLLKNSMALPRLTHVLRTSSLADHSLVHAFDCTLRRVTEDLLNLRMTDHQWKQATLPVRHGGIGLRSAGDVALPAFISSCRQNRSLCSEISGLPGIADQVAAIDLWLERAGAAAVPENSAQAAWDAPLIDKAINSLLHEAVDEKSRARLLAASSEFSGAWLDALPAPSLGLMLSGNEIRIAIGLRIGAKLVHPHTCIACGDQVCCEGIHGLSCRSSAGRFTRHAAANDVIRRALSSADVPSVLEPSGLSRQDGRRPDGLTLIPWSQGRCLLWDFTCSDTLAQSHVHQSSVDAGSAANAAEARKLAHYSDLSHDYVFAPVAIETLGSSGELTGRFLRDLCKRLVVGSGDRRAGQYFRQRLGLVIQRGNVISVLGTMERGECLFSELDADAVSDAALGIGLSV